MAHEGRTALLREIHALPTTAATTEPSTPTGQ